MQRAGCILGIDVGTRNLALCCLRPAARPADDVVARWAVLSVPGSKHPGAEDVHVALRLGGIHEWIPEIAQVVIERQPARTNPTMARVQAYLEMWFAMNAVPVYVQDARAKLTFAMASEWFPRDAPTHPWTYYRRKQLAIATATAFVNETAQDLTDMYIQSKKKDDLADSLFHAMAFAHRTHQAPDIVIPPPPAPTKVIARKPTPRQTASGRYSPSNVKYLLKTHAASADAVARAADANLPLRRAIQRHFGSSEACHAALF